MSFRNCTHYKWKIILVGAHTLENDKKRKSKSDLRSFRNYCFFGFALIRFTELRSSEIRNCTHSKEMSSSLSKGDPADH